jgi:hypothetical protein
MARRQQTQTNRPKAIAAITNDLQLPTSALKQQPLRFDWCAQVQHDGRVPLPQPNPAGRGSVTLNLPEAGKPAAGLGRG